MRWLTTYGPRWRVWANRHPWHQLLHACQPPWFAIDRDGALATDAHSAEHAPATGCACLTESVNANRHEGGRDAFARASGDFATPEGERRVLGMPCYAWLSDPQEFLFAWFSDLRRCARQVVAQYAGSSRWVASMRCVTW